MSFMSSSKEEKNTHRDDDDDDDHRQRERRRHQRDDDGVFVKEIAPNVFMPRVAFGTYKLKGEGCSTAVARALECGYEHIDTASIYKNETDIGDALNEWMKTGERKMPFVASKIAPAEMHSQLLVEQAVSKILGRLRLRTIDLIMLHWPGVSKVSPDSEIHKEKRKNFRYSS